MRILKLALDKYANGWGGFRVIGMVLIGIVLCFISYLTSVRAFMIFACGWLGVSFALAVVCFARIDFDSDVKKGGGWYG